MLQCLQPQVGHEKAMHVDQKSISYLHSDTATLLATSSYNFCDVAFKEINIGQISKWRFSGYLIRATIDLRLVYNTTLDPT